ncbi:hypothetical protein [Geodermatophilus chilensis]|uniref:hypothetical protein n=1 Tax=Geodermatophilus chilensis TaxID=2035835 RepID=UPI000C25F2FF|nr:hypothetical protein [Geodermatophilus chilensis]
MTITPARQPAAVARRQLLRDRFAELLTEWGSPHAAERAAHLMDAVDDAGFTLPPALDDAPPPPSHSTPEGRARARQLFEETRAAHAGDTAARGVHQ